MHDWQNTPFIFLQASPYLFWTIISRTRPGKQLRAMQYVLWSKTNRENLPAEVKTGNKLHCNNWRPKPVMIILLCNRWLKKVFLQDIMSHKKFNDKYGLTSTPKDGKKRANSTTYYYLPDCRKEWLKQGLNMVVFGDKEEVKCIKN